MPCYGYVRHRAGHRRRMSLTGEVECTSEAGARVYLERGGAARDLRMPGRLYRPPLCTAWRGPRGPGHLDVRLVVHKVERGRELVEADARGELASRRVVQVGLVLHLGRQLARNCPVTVLGMKC